MNVKKLPHDTDFQTRAVDIHTLLISIHIYRKNLMAAFKYQLHNNFGVFLRQNSCSLNYWDPFRKLKRKLYDFSSQVGGTRSSFWVIYRNIFQFASICWHPDAKTSALRSLLTHEVGEMQQSALGNTNFKILGFFCFQPQYYCLLNFKHWWATGDGERF